MKITIQTDEENDQLYILFRRKADMKGIVKKTIKLSEDIVLDLDAKGKLVGIDLMNATKILGIKNLGEINFDILMGVAEAAALFGVKKPNFIRDYVHREDFPKPIVELASGRIWLRKDLERYIEKKLSKSA